MNYEVTGKVNAIKTDIPDSEEELDDYDDEELDFEDEHNEPEREPEDNPPSNNKNDDLKKRLIKLMLIIGGGMLILLLILFLISALFSKSYTYENVEEVMKNAAMNYFEEHKENLPKDETQTVEIQVNTLVEAGKMKTLDDYLGKDCGCTGRVEVKLAGTTYVYIPYLTCGDKYATKFLAGEVTKEENLVASGYGLYLANDGYVFKGETVNNYVQLESRVWRIVKVNSDKSITLILNRAADREYPYDDRYNQQADYDYGINNYQTSRIREQLELMYNETNPEEEENYILTEKDKTHLVNFDLCIGKMSKTDTIHDNSIECTQTITDKIGLLTASDYMNASADVNCNVVGSNSCQNYNYLSQNGTFWLMTPSTKDSYSTLYVGTGTIKESESSENKKVRPVITLAANTLISGGDGSEANPYVVK